MQCLINDARVDAVLAPSPVYPLYSAMTTILDGASALYPLHENFDTGVWTVRLADLEGALQQARAAGTRPRALVVINPGNPTGQCMSQGEVRAVLEFAAREGLVVLADEVRVDPEDSVARQDPVSEPRLPSGSDPISESRRVTVTCVVLADEVYQDNVYNAPGTTRLAHVSNEFHSFRAALRELHVGAARCCCVFPHACRPVVDSTVPAGS